MIRFESDYLEGAHPSILKALTETNFEQTPGYGVDDYCERARAKIAEKLGTEVAGIHFLVGGTQCNLTCCAAFLKPWQGALCADTGHIAVHESGAVEASGHKVLTVPHKFGKISAKQVNDYCKAHYASDTAEHTVQPGMLYISQPTEYGTLYTLKEIKALSRACKKNNLVFYVDGARLGYALACKENDVTLKDLATYTDAFYIGGTKVGCLFGEALVIKNKELNNSFRYMIKQRGGMLAKGRLLGIQFDALFTDDLYEKMGLHAMTLAEKIANCLTSLGVSFAVPSPTNQIFPVLTDEQYAALSEKYSFSFWEKTKDGRNVVRICTSWATKEEDADALINDLKNVLSR